MNGNDHFSWRSTKKHQGGQVLAGEVLNIRFGVASPKRIIVEEGLQVPARPAPHDVHETPREGYNRVNQQDIVPKTAQSALQFKRIPSYSTHGVSRLGDQSDAHLIPQTKYSQPHLRPQDGWVRSNHRHIGRANFNKDTYSRSILPDMASGGNGCKIRAFTSLSPARCSAALHCRSSRSFSYSTSR